MKGVELRHDEVRWVFQMDHAGGVVDDEREGVRLELGKTGD